MAVEVLAAALADELQPLQEGLGVAFGGEEVEAEADEFEHADPAQAG